VVPGRLPAYTSPGVRAKEQVASVVKDGGLRPIDVGPVHRAIQLEHLGLLHMALQERLGANFASALKLVW
jgi:predicted dinucleotide-binding enzyme